MVKDASKRTAKQAHVAQKPLFPLLSDILKMSKFTNLEIVASDRSLQEVIRVGDWCAFTTSFHIYLFIVDI